MKTAARKESQIKNPSLATSPSVPTPNAPVVSLSVRLPQPTHEVLRRIAFDRRVSIHSLILEGIGKVIAEKR